MGAAANEARALRARSHMALVSQNELCMQSREGHDQLQSLVSSTLHKLLHMYMLSACTGIQLPSQHPAAFRVVVTM